MTIDLDEPRWPFLGYYGNFRPKNREKFFLPPQKPQPKILELYENTFTFSDFPWFYKMRKCRVFGAKIKKPTQAGLEPAYTEC